MIYSSFQNEKLSLLGFGAMRLPCDASGTVDEAQVAEMVRIAFEGGVNYIDTAYPYHAGQSEAVLGRVLANYPRDSYKLASKFPGHQISERYDPAAIFEEQLRKCKVDHFDFYLLHNVYEKSIHTYADPRWGIVDYFLEQKRLGRIRHLGFSSHAGYACLKDFLDRYGSEMEFCQIQLNYLDWTLQDAKARYELLTQRGVPVWVMEPLRGGKLAKLNPADADALRALRPDEGAPAWAFRWLQGLDGVRMILSGMSSPEQMRDNLRAFEARKPLTAAEGAKLLAIADGMKNSVPCTACRYCCDGCPQGLDIPSLLAAYNDFRFAANSNITMAMEALPEDKRPSSCIGCGACAQVCPQNIDIPGALKDFSEVLAKQPSWAEICRQRDEAQQKNRG